MDEIVKNFQIEFDRKMSKVIKIQEDVSFLQADLNSVYTDLKEFFKTSCKQHCKQLKDNSTSKVKKSLSDECDIVKFNIGGTVFSTFRTTISKKILKPSLLKEFYASNLLEHMMKGEIEVTYDEYQTIFIDRSPKYFNYILDYLRTANTNEEFILPKNKIFLQELLREARFYQIIGLKDSIKDLYNQIARSNRQEKHKSEQDSDSEHEVNNGYRKKSIKQVISQDSLSKEKAFFDSVINLDQNAIGQAQKVLKVNSQHIEKQQETVIQSNGSLNTSVYKIEQKVPIVEEKQVTPSPPQSLPQTPIEPPIQSSPQLTSQTPTQLPASSSVQTDRLNEMPSPIPSIPSKIAEEKNIQVNKQEISLESTSERKLSSGSNIPVETLSASILNHNQQNGNLDDSFVSIPKIQSDESQSLTKKGETSSRVRTSESSSVISQGRISIDMSLSQKDSSYTYFKNTTISYMVSSKAIYINFENFTEQIGKLQPIIDDCLDPYETKSSKLCIGQYNEDELYYRCRVLEWNAEKNEARCHFIDFGNTENVCIDTITKMPSHLRRVKPLVLYCKLDDDIEMDSSEYKQLSELANSETRFDIKVKTAELESFYGAKNYDYGPITVELETSLTHVNVNKLTLAQSELWNQVHTLETNPQSAEPIKQNAPDEWDTVKASNDTTK